MLTRLLGVVLIAFIPLQVPEDYPGQSRHEKPPDGWFCSHNDPNPAKACACKREDPSHDCDDPTQAPEDRICKVYCWKNHCHCRLICSHPEHAPGEGPEDQPPSQEDE